MGASGNRGLIFFVLLCLILREMRQRFLVVEHRAEIAHVKLTAGRIARLPRRGAGPRTEGSTMPVAEIRRHAGIVRVRRYSFDMP
jgi:hypothetical protein